MSDAAQNINPTPNRLIPQITALSTAFPMNFESTTPKRPTTTHPSPIRPNSTINPPHTQAPSK